MTVGTRVTHIRGVLLADGTGPVDVAIGPDGRVASVRPAVPDTLAELDSPPSTGGELDLPGWLLLPATVEPHAHLDKALSWDTINPPYGDLRQAIDSWHGFSARLTEADLTYRARTALTRYLAAGTTAVRSHVDILTGSPDPLLGVRTMIALREELSDVLDLQVCPLFHAGTPTELIERALELGADLLGGCPHLCADPVAEITRLFELAERYDVDLDLHTDEQLNPAALSLRELARQTSSRDRSRQASSPDRPRRVTASHCVSLAMLAPEVLRELLEEVRAAGVAVVTLPITNLYLQGRDHPGPVPRGLTTVRALLDAGVTVAAGGDNLRDPFNPVGRADPFETTSLLITAAHLDARQALHAVTSAGREVLGLPPTGPVEGRRADLVAVRANGLPDALAGPTGSRIVLRGGTIVASTEVSIRTALDSAAPALGSGT